MLETILITAQTQQSKVFFFLKKKIYKLIHSNIQKNSI